jgi:tetratricopeptide (TPR) repeat protein
VLVAQAKWIDAIAAYQQGIELGNATNFTQAQHAGHYGLAVTYLLQNTLQNARQEIEQTLQYHVPSNNANAQAVCGIVAWRQGEIETALNAFQKSIEYAEARLAKTSLYYDMLNVKGLALAGLALATGDMKHRETALSAFQAARNIFAGAGYVGSILRLYDALDVDNTLGLRSVIDPNPQQ